MKRHLILLLLCFPVYLFSGCFGQNKTDIFSVNPEELTDIPVISIETENGLDFVTKPVATHVAESIASWTPDYEMPPAPYYEACAVSLTDSDQTLLLDNVNAQVKVRGNWTTSYDKKPLRIKFDEPQNLLGLNDGATFKNWLLLAEYKDASMLRNKTALALANEFLAEDNLYVSDAALVEVMINGQYWGVYLLAEQQQVNKDRVDITEPEPGYTGTDIGYFLEMDGYFRNEAPLQQFVVSYADNAPLIPYDGNDGSGRTMTCLTDKKHGNKNDIGITIKSDIYSREQHDFIETYVNHVYDIMYAASYTDEAYVFNEDYTEIVKTTEISPREAIEQVIDVSSLVDIYILNELFCDADVYWSSFFLSVDFGPEGNKKLTFEAPWDFDSAMGLKDRCLDGTGFYASNIVPDVNGGPQGGGD
ncbi:MAG: CotH kinase family protein, partial [Lachnospiraceae bacterium]|nr:CotH kinase family protein [Lachnospiraceae bacterium]